MKTNLFRNNEKEYGNDYKNHYIEQYKIYLESIEKISDRRQSANKFFITINTVLISIIGLSFQNNFLKDILSFKLFITFVGVLFCVMFWFLIRSYKQLNDGKFKVLHKIESKLPLAIYKYEWELLEKGENKQVYYPFSRIELLVPWLFGFIYFMLWVIFICK
ncbi:MAG: hypothetical protein KAT05_09565 [Spirochaetes bacterium]|nr:hypothetical protein [Spirochaetota bacterium]